MKTRIAALIGLIAVLVSACIPVSTPAAPTPTETGAAPIAGVAVVQSIEVQILESDPLQVNAIVRGQLPDAGCTTIASVDQVREGNKFKITLRTTTDPLALCAQALTPFEEVVSLDVRDLPPGEYIVNVNGVEQSFELPTHNASSFDQVLVEALNARNYDLLKTLMGDPFMIGYWLSEGTSNTPEQAIEQLRINLLNSSAPIVADPDKDMVALLGTDPITIVGPDVIEASPLFTSGWGAEGRAEVILFIAKKPDGDLYWHGLLFAKDGFEQFAPTQPADTSVHPTDVQYVMAQQDVTIYNGPGASFGEVGQVFNGQIAKVTGTDSTGSWWRVLCPDESVGSCWVSADTNLTLPTTLPHTNQPTPVSEAIPTISIVAVLQDNNVTIQTHDYPGNTDFDVRMGEIGTLGINGVLVATINSGKGGSFTSTFDIPQKLYGQDKIAIRLESRAGYYSYNWFLND